MLPIFTKAQSSGNPIFEGWYADPEAQIFGKTYWIYPTFSAKKKDREQKTYKT